MDLQITGLRVLVTAGASGIGLQIARAFVAEGANVHVCDIDEQALAALGQSDPALGRSRADVANRDDTARLFKDAVGRLGGLDVLVNNAGIAGPTGRVDKIAPEEWDQTLAVNITGQFNCARLAVEHLQRSDNPSIVNLASVAGRHGFAKRTPYAASKWAVVGFSKSLSIELGEFDIRVNAILPGAIDGPRIQRVFAAKAAERGVAPEDIQAEVLSTMSLKRLIDPSDIGRLIVFICSPMGRNISGQALSVCGDAQMLI